jgi:hypothetical protein
LELSREQAVDLIATLANKLRCESLTIDADIYGLLQSGQPPDQEDG